MKGGRLYSQKLQNNEIDLLVMCMLRFDQCFECIGTKTNVIFMHLSFLPLFENCKRMNYVADSGDI